MSVTTDRLNAAITAVQTARVDYDRPGGAHIAALVAATADSMAAGGSFPSHFITKAHQHAMPGDVLMALVSLERELKTRLAVAGG